MAKQNQPQQTKHELPSVGDLPSVSVPAGEVPVIQDTPAPVKQMLDAKMCTCMLEAPMLQFDGVGFVKRRFDIKLTLDQAMALKGLKLGLEAQGAVLRDGSRVKHIQDAVRWMLENLAS
jgi:hypothetical protein